MTILSIIEFYSFRALITMKPIKLFLIVSTFIFPGTAISEPHTTHTNYSYHVDFDNTQSQTEALDDIQKQVKNKTDDKELKIILFGRGRALSLDANALSDTKIVYGNNNETIKNKISELKNKGVRLIICKKPTDLKRHYSTKQTSASIEKELQRLKSQGYNCN